jgi:hypothetical protein
MVRLVPVTVALALLLVRAAGFDAQPEPARVDIQKRFTPADQQTGRYQYIPFDVPEGTTSLRVAYTYDKADGANVVDLGLFEPGPIDLGTKAFRGYSGGARSEVVLTTVGATPGYRRGPIPPGQWNLLLGLYRIAPSGVDVSITIETQRDASAAAQPAVQDEQAPQLKPPQAMPSWFRGALHTHTTHSDGTVSPRELVQMFAARGFNFIALTDHNNTTHVQDLKGLEWVDGRFPLLITGEEVTTPGGHASVWGLPANGWVDFRVLPGDGRIRDLVESARRQGAMFSVNHPASECLACGWTHEIVEGIEGIEISNGRHGEVDRALAIWDQLLASGRKITAVGSSDWHSKEQPIDDAHVRVFAFSLTQDGVLSAIRGGRVIVMTDVEAETPEIDVRAGELSAGVGDSLPLGTAKSVAIRVNAVAAPRGRLIVVQNGQPAEPIELDEKGVAKRELDAAPGYVRFEIRRADGSALAYTNPVYLVAQ